LRGRGAEPPGLAEGKPEDRLREAEWGSEPPHAIAIPEKRKERKILHLPPVGKRG